MTCYMTQTHNSWLAGSAFRSLLCSFVFCVRVECVCLCPPCVISCMCVPASVRVDLCGIGAVPLLCGTVCGMCSRRVCPGRISVLLASLLFRDDLAVRQVAELPLHCLASSAICCCLLCIASSWTLLLCCCYVSLQYGSHINTRTTGECQNVQTCVLF